MKLQKLLLKALCVSGSVWVVAMNSATTQKVQARQINDGQVSSAKIPYLNEVELPNKSAYQLVQSPAPGVVTITGVKANPTDKGLEIILETTQGDKLQVTNRSTGNNFIADVSGGQLRLPSGEAFTFRSEKPLAGITEIIVTNVDANIVRVTVAGENALPTVELFEDDNVGLVFGVAPTTTATQPPQQEAPQTTEKPATEAPQDKPAAQQDEPIELVVTGEQDGYSVPDVSTATKTDTPLRDIPQSIQVVPRRVIEDQQATRLPDALRNVSGIAQGSSSRAIFETVLSRGFSTSNVLRNGLRQNILFNFGFNNAAIERLEVLKGPASVLYGQGNLGGTINYVTKQPLRDPYYFVEGSVGSFDFYRGAIDLSGPLNADRTVLYRLNASAQTAGSFVDFLDDQRYFVTPVITWQIGDRTKLTVEAEYFYVSNPFDYGLPAIGSVLPNPNGKIPRNRNVGEPSNSIDYQAFRIGYDLEHRFSENWKVRSAFAADFRDYDSNVIFGSTLLNDNRTLNRGFGELSFSQNFYNLDNYVVGNFSTGSIQHQLVVGLNLSRQENPTYERTDGVAVPIDVFNPIYNSSRVRVTSLSDTKFRSDALGIYLQDQITLLPNLKLLLGGRFDIANQKRDDLIQSITQFQQQEAFSPRVGIVYQPVPPISLYASYGRSFQPAGSIFGNTLPKPEEGTQYEVGIKADLTNRLSATLAFYNLTRSNVTTADPNNPLLSIQVGEQRSRGIEFDLAGEILPGWNIIASYALTDAEVTKDNTFQVGNLLNNVPKHSFSLWTTYTIQRGSLQGFGVGAGVFYVGDRQGDLANTFELPSYFRTDAAIFYRRDRFRAALNFKNLFNINYFESALSRLIVYPSEPFTVQGTISWQF